MSKYKCNINPDFPNKSVQKSGVLIVQIEFGIDVSIERTIGKRNEKTFIDHNQKRSMWSCGDASIRQWLFDSRQELPLQKASTSSYPCQNTTYGVEQF